MERGPSARFLLRPRWLASHLLVVLLVVVMINLGFWQLRRLDEKRERNALIEERQAAAEVPVEQLLSPDDGEAAVDTARYRAVVARGTYDADATVVVRNRTQDGAPGVWMLTPLRLDGGDRVGIIRGFVPLGADGEPAPTPPPEGEVTVQGWVARADRFDGTAPRDIEPLVEQPGMLPAVVLAETSDPPDADAGTGAEAEAEGGAADEMVTVPLPELSEGPHLGYAVQWFIFSTIAAVGYPLVLRRVVQRRGKEVDDHDVPDMPGTGPTDLDRELEQLLREGR